MSMGIERQSEQYGAFTNDPGVYAQRDRVAVYDVPDGVPEYLASARPSIATGLLNTRHAMGIAIPSSGGISDPHGPYGSGIDSFAYPSEPEGHEDQQQWAGESGLNQQPPEDPYGGQEPGVPLQGLDDMLEHAHRPDPHEPPGHFSSARRRDANSDGPDSVADRTLTALAVPPAQPALPAAPVWLGHTYVPGDRVGLPWRGQMIPGTVTHLEGYNVGVRYDDGQHAVEEPSAIQPLHQWS